MNKYLLVFFELMKNYFMIGALIQIFSGGAYTMDWSTFWTFLFMGAVFSIVWSIIDDVMK